MASSLGPACAGRIAECWPGLRALLLSRRPRASLHRPPGACVEGLRAQPEPGAQGPLVVGEGLSSDVPARCWGPRPQRCVERAQTSVWRETAALGPTGRCLAHTPASPLGGPPGPTATPASCLPKASSSQRPCFGCTAPHTHTPAPQELTPCPDGPAPFHRPPRRAPTEQAVPGDTPLTVMVPPPHSFTPLPGLSRFFPF